MTAIAVKERPILFSGPMVQAILDGRKTMTRRIMKPQPPSHAIEVFDWRAPDIAESVKASEGCYYNDMDGLHFHCKCPYGAVGDRLWVRESLKQKANNDYSNSRHSASTDWVYSSDNELLKPNWVEMAGWSVHRSKPSIHMPRWASRITLDITGIRVERLNDITEQDAIAEGCQCAGVPASLTNRGAFAKLWESINGKDSWSANPWVWVVEFKRL